jgi:hypothetical protein
MREWLQRVFEGRPMWMNVLMVFSAYMAFVYLPWDIFVKPAVADEEVWFGIRFHGGVAKFLALFHWAIYAAGAYGFRYMKSWMWPWAAVYAAQVAFSMLVWPWIYMEGILGFSMGVIAVVPFALLTFALWNAQSRFEATRPPLRGRYGEWALVTGASAGIGAEFARALARDGLSVVLTARRDERLSELASELEQSHRVRTRVVGADLSRPDDVERLAEAVADLDVAVLVNNAGVGYAGAFAKQDAVRLRAMVEVNCTAPVVLTSRLLPRMLERGGKTAIVFSGSIAGRQPLPFQALYGATKAFDLLFGEALSVELRGSGVDVLVLEPGVTETEFQEKAGQIAHAGESAADVVATALEALGRRPAVIPGWWNWLRANAAMRLLPRELVAHLARDVVARHTPPELR